MATPYIDFETIILHLSNLANLALEQRNDKTAESHKVYNLLLSSLRTILFMEDNNRTQIISINVTSSLNRSPYNIF